MSDLKKNWWARKAAQSMVCFFPPGLLLLTELGVCDALTGRNTSDVEEIYFDASTTWYVSVCMNVPNEKDKMQLYASSSFVCDGARL